MMLSTLAYKIAKKKLLNFVARNIVCLFVYSEARFINLSSKFPSSLDAFHRNIYYTAFY